VARDVPNPDGVFVPASMRFVQLEGRAEYMAMLIDDKAIMTDRIANTLCPGPETKATRRTSCLAASMTACGWCSPAWGDANDRSLSPVSRRSSHRQQGQTQTGAMKRRPQCNP